MRNSWKTSQAVIVDANVAVWAVLPVLAEVQTVDLFEGWTEKDVEVLAPSFWIAEACSVVRRMAYQKKLTMEESEEAIEHLFGLQIRSIPMTVSLCLRALSWAARLQQIRLYDSLYIAAAEQQSAVLWSGDKRLINRLRQCRFSNVQSVFELEEA